MANTLELKKNNLYVTGTVYVYPDGTQKLLRKRVKYVGTVKDSYHRIVQGDTLDKLAYKYYGKVTEDASKYWWILADVNNILNPLDLSDVQGVTLVIPDFYTIKLLLQK